VAAIDSQKEVLRKELGKAAANKVRVQKVYAAMNTALTVPPPLSPNATMAEKVKRFDDLSAISSNLLKKLNNTQSSIVRNLK